MVGEFHLSFFNLKKLGASKKMQTFKATTDPRLNKKPIIESQNWLKKKKIFGKH